MMKKLPSVLQKHRPQDFFGPDDWSGGDPKDDIKAIKKAQEEWDKAYDSLSFFDKVPYNLFG